MTRIEREKRTVKHMVTLYCRAHHACGKQLCPECSKLLEYAESRLARCRWGNCKPTCKRCPIHCYRPSMRLQMQSVMRYAGPRMLWHHPIEAFLHLFGK